MGRAAKLIAIVLAGVLSIPAVFLLSLEGLLRMVRAEYASGARTSTDGGSVMIPAMGLTYAWTVLLLVTATIVFAVGMIRRRRRRGSVEQGVAPDGQSPSAPARRSTP